jgi:hypothetical protein
MVRAGWEIRNSQPALLPAARDIARERHYSVSELGKIWSLSEKTIRRTFENEPGVLQWREAGSALHSRLHNVSTLGATDPACLRWFCAAVTLLRRIVLPRGPVRGCATREGLEGVRIAYVAATRARDLLVVPVLGMDRIQGWLTPLDKATYPKGEERLVRRPAAGCPEFGLSTILDGPRNQSICPGLHKPEAGSHEVVWWDPSNLRLGVDAKLGLRTIDLLKGDAALGTLAGLMLPVVVVGRQQVKPDYIPFTMVSPSRLTMSPQLCQPQ